MKHIKQLLALTAVIGAAGILVACGQQKTQATKGATWVRMASDTINTMDPSLNTDIVGGQQLVDTMEGLYRYRGQKLTPGLATEVVQPSADGLIYTYHLRDSSWTNGKPVTAQDFVYSWQRSVAPATKSQYANLFADIQNATEITAGKLAPSTLGVKALDAHTLQVTLTKPVPYFNKMLVNPIFFPQSATAVKRYGAKYGTQAKYLLTNGPYTLTQWNGTGDSWVAAKNPKYWDAKQVHLKRIKTQVVKDPAAANALYQAGKLDDATLTGALAAKAMTAKDYQGLRQSATFYLELNEQRVPAFKNAKIRQALSMAINRPQFIKQVLEDASLPAKTLTPRGLATESSSATDFAKAAAAGQTAAYTDYDLKTAKRLWQEGKRELGIAKLTVSLLGDDIDLSKRTSEYLQSTLQQLDGLTIDIQSLPFKTRLARSTAKDFDLVISAWSADFPDPISFLKLMTTDNAYNNGSWSNPQYDALIKAAATTDATAPAKRDQDLLQAERLLMQQQGVIPLYQRVSAHLVDPALRGASYSPAGKYNYVGATLQR